MPSSQAFARSSIVGYTVNALTTQKAFLNNFGDIVNRRVGIQEDIENYQNMLSSHQMRLITAWEKIFTCCNVA